MSPRSHCGYPEGAGWRALSDASHGGVGPAVGPASEPPSPGSGRSTCRPMDVRGRSHSVPRPRRHPDRGPGADLVAAIAAPMGIWPVPDAAHECLGREFANSVPPLPSPRRAPLSPLGIAQWQTAVVFDEDRERLRPRSGNPVRPATWSLESWGRLPTAARRYPISPARQHAAPGQALADVWMLAHKSDAATRGGLATGPKHLWLRRGRP